LERAKNHADEHFENAGLLAKINPFSDARSTRRTARRIYGDTLRLLARIEGYQEDMAAKARGRLE
jgi:hypothetical protein